MNTNKIVKCRRFIVPKKVEQINDHLFIDTYKSNNINLCLGSWSQISMGAILVYVSLMYLYKLTTWGYWRIVQIQQETYSKYAMNSVNDIQLSSMLLSSNVCYVFLLIDHAACLMPQLLSSILVAMLERL